MARARIQTIICKICKQPKQRHEVKLKPNGAIKESICHSCRLKTFLDTKGNYSYRKYKLKACARCGFTGEPCQLDVDHIDNNHKNSDPSNLQTLCANCHRLKTHNARRSRG